MKNKGKKAVGILAVLVLVFAGVRAFYHERNPRLGGTFLINTQRVDSPPNMNAPEMKRVIAEINAQIPSVETVSTWTANDADKVTGYLHKRLITNP